MNTKSITISVMYNVSQQTPIRKILFSSFILLITISFFRLSFAQDSDSILFKELQDNIYELRIENGKFVGAGARVISEALAGPQFILIGEQHGIREVPEFSDVLFKAAHQKGFQYICIETDPFVAAKLEQLAKNGNSNFREFNQSFPMSIPFYNWVEEFDFLVQAVGRSSSEKPVLWGIDQIYMAAPRYLFSRLAELAHNEQSRNVALEYFNKAQQAFSDVMQTGDPGKMIMVSLTPDDFQKLNNVFSSNPNAETHRIIAGIQESQQIYMLWVQGKQYKNNRTRSKLMKRQFMEYYLEASITDELPKVLLKFGSGHMYRGLSVYEQFDIGNMVSEMAEMNGSHSLHTIKGFTIY